MISPVISVRDLRMSYGELEAVRGVDLEVELGEVFAFLGPNGAGKTTTVEILEGHRRRSGGEVEVLGHDPEQVTRARGSGRAWRDRLGIVLQSCNLEPFLSVRESLELYAGYFSSPRPVGEVIELVGLGGKAGERAGRLSGGQQRRLDVGMALIGDPDLVFLDEPTTGFDPSARRQAWEMIGGLRDLGKTIFLTTHYMEEAQALADRVAIIDAGRVVASGTPEGLGERSQEPSRITFTLGPAAPELPLAELAPEAWLDPGSSDGSVAMLSRSPAATLNLLTGWALERGVELESLEVRRPSLEDTYLRLTAGPEEARSGSGP